MLQKQKTRRPPSKVERFFEYFVTPSGRRLSFYLAGAGAFGLACANYLPHTVCLDYYRDFVQHYTFGLPTKVPEHVQQRIDRAADRLNFNNAHKKLIKSFTVTGFNVFEIGSLKTIYGGWIGVPSNFYYNSVEDIDKDNIYIRNERVKWNTEHGKLLEQSLLFSESEQTFAVCRALLDLQSFKLYLNTITPTVVFLSIYFAAQKINQGQNLYGRSLLVRLVLYSLLGIFGYGIYSFTTDFVNFQHEREVDLTLADLGTDMIEAGVGFYTKLLNRNVAIRELSGKDLYTAKGNEKYFMRIRAIPLTTRKAFFESKLDELNESATDGENVTDEDDKREATKEAEATGQDKKQS